MVLDQKQDKFYDHFYKIKKSVPFKYIYSLFE